MFTDLSLVGSQLAIEFNKSIGVLYTHKMSCDTIKLMCHSTAQS